MSRHRCVALLVIIFSAASLAMTSAGRKDVLYLKNGTVVKGIIVEQKPNDKLKLQVDDETFYVYNMADIDSIAKEEEPDRFDEAAAMPSRPGVLSVMGGLAFPLGDFGATVGERAGGAKTGFGLAASYEVPMQTSSFWQFSALFNSNAMDGAAVAASLGGTYSVTAGSFSTTCLLTGPGLLSPLSETMTFFGAVQLGAMFGSTPEITITNGSARAVQTSASGTAVAFGLLGGFRSGGRLSIGVQYVSGQPKYEVTATGTGGTTVGTIEQSTALLQVLVGVSL